MTDLPFTMKLMEEELIRDEGVRFAPYRDSLGFWTVGVGHLILNEDGSPETDETKLPKIWTRATVYKILDEDILIAYNRIKDHNFFKALDTDSRRMALINMSFNLGNKLFEFKNFLKYLSKSQFTLAANSLVLSHWHTQVPERANRIISVIRGM